MNTSGIYRHFKGGLYLVMMEAKDSETLADMLVYKSLDSGSVWVRKKSEFFGKTENGTTRFQPYSFQGENS